MADLFDKHLKGLTNGESFDFLNYLTVKQIRFTMYSLYSIGHVRVQLYA